MTADVAPRSSLSASLSASLPASPGLTLREVFPRTLVELRVAENIQPALGFALPGAGRASADAVWLGPNWWLLDLDPADPTVQPEVVRRLRAAHPGVSAVDVSAGYAVLQLAGADARAVLAHGCSIDLHPRVFGPGSAARTTLAKAQVVLAQNDDVPTYRIWVRTSFARYLAAWLIDASVEYV